MPIQTRSLLILGHNPIQRITHVRAHVLIPILVQTQRAARVLHEQVQDAYFVIADLGKALLDVGGDEVAATAAARKGDAFLKPGHGAGRLGRARGMGWEGGW